MAHAAVPLPSLGGVAVAPPAVAQGCHAEAVFVLGGRLPVFRDKSALGVLRVGEPEVQVQGTLAEGGV